MSFSRLRFASLLIAALYAGWVSVAAAQTPTAALHWITSWACAQQIPEPQNAMSQDALTNATLRETVHLSVGGEQIRLRLSNAFGTQPLTVMHVRVAVPASLTTSRTLPDSDHEVRFHGDTTAVIPAGAELLSDPITMHAGALSSLTISMYLPKAPAGQTSHPGSRATSYYVHGDQTAAIEFPSDAGHMDHWFQLTAVEVEAKSTDAFTIVALGDSITDGHGATTNENNRWTDRFAERLHAQFGDRVAVTNAGIGGNRVLLDGLGPNAVARFDRDVLTPAGVRWVILLEGVNDLGTATRDHEITEAEHAQLVQRILGAYEQMIEKAHEHGIKVAGATITPYIGSDYYHPGPANEADRTAINQWIRSSEHFDAVVDFDALVRDPASPSRLLPSFDSGDHLHPSVSGYAAMADGISIAIFSRSAAAKQTRAPKPR